MLRWNIDGILISEKKEKEGKKNRSSSRQLRPLPLYRITGGIQYKRKWSKLGAQSSIRVFSIVPPFLFETFKSHSYIPPSSSFFFGPKLSAHP